jgi:pyridoxamine 5'-phosphate oxidase
MSLADLRKDYALAGLVESDLAADPIAQFRVWFEEARTAAGHEPNAMTVATASPDGVPSARMVLLKGLDERGFVFYSNYESHKGHDLEANPHVELLFYWPEVERQVRISGVAEPVSREETAEYFYSRPRGSQIGSLASPQSQVIANREALESRYAELERSLEGSDVPVPERWGGYRVRPDTVEFWQGRRSRLHDRLRYRRDSAGGWTVERLAP